MADFLAHVTTREDCRRYKRKAAIFSAGDPANKVFYLCQGKVKITAVSKQGREAVVSIIQPRQFFGQSCLNGRSVRVATATAMDYVEVIGIKRQTFETLLSADRSFANAFMLYLLEYGERLEAELIDQLIHTSEQRLARLLLTLASHYGTHRDPAPILGEIDRVTMAQKIGTTRQHVSKFMAKFRRLGLISQNGTIEVHQSLLQAVLHKTK